MPTVGHWLPAALRQTAPSAVIVEVAASRRLTPVHETLVVHGRYDLLLDLCRLPRLPRRFAVLLFHCQPGATLVSALPTRAKPRRRSLRWCAALAEASRSGSYAMPVPAAGSPPDAELRNDEAATIASVAAIEVVRGHLVTANRSAALAKVADRSLNDILAQRGGPDRVVETLPAVTWQPRSVVRCSSRERLAKLPTSYDVPELSLREFHGAVCLPRAAVFKDNLVLPASFRYTARKRTGNRALADWGLRFVGEPDVSPAELPGSWFHLDSEFRGHFGHALAEQVPRLWGWFRARELDPSVRGLMFARGGRRELASWERDLWTAAGLGGDDLVLAQESVRVERLYTATPMTNEPHFTHPEVARTFAVLGAGLAARARPVERPRRIFVSRRSQVRRCMNAGEVEALFRERGFTVIHPEDHPLPEQVALFRDAEVIAGFSGSGMFTTALTGGPRHVIVVGPETYNRHNEYLMAAAVGHRLDLVVCQAHAPRRSPDTPRKNWPYTFDRAREGVFLREILADL